jgi:hypothetical protein
MHEDSNLIVVAGVENKDSRDATSGDFEGGVVAYANDSPGRH